MEETMQVFAAMEDEVLASRLKAIIEQTIPVRNEFHRCGNVDDSLRLASYYGPHVVFVDERLPKFCEFVSEIRREIPSAVVILVMATGGVRSLAVALACGARDYLARDAVGIDAVDRCLWSAVSAWKEPKPARASEAKGRRRLAAVWS